ncbi:MULTISPECIES: DUF5996 family protein [unclassified Arthrobacter]|uniref:DUF5996 family protein n=1 Tax=unclassified Arthrobacter TaxID=235627 RepID=UPI001D150A0B|nr:MULTISPECIES: DUF5996 family protein [unclassified Arthrobacter]MCC3277418.1 DUF5996 family protein [Arthrobacter sp. zg-Y20]MCC3279986.1 DUF5996 family protein [Arthrobacter sp. zg-Y40]MCC9178268.1 DUF5996 family protein [Arthrobacter sp. zg-Y750]MDK1317578.1 DUF5996 family protein [Arthrobacter sp. zg.Y20]MDK1328336.1 DUF5996 family protein [Arthrobacter sp. zg-Y1143]
MDKNFLNYPDWQATADTLHLFLQMAGKVKVERSCPEPEWAHVRMPLTVQGIGTGVIPGPDTNFEIYFNLREHHVDVQNTNYIRTRLDLTDGLSVAGFYQQLMDALEFIEAPTPINTEPQEFYDPVPFDADTKHHSYDRHAVELFLDNLHFAQRSLSQFLAPVRGKVHLPAYWFGTMDISGAIYSGQSAPYPGKGAIAANSFDERFCEFGFWPGDPSSIEPAFYVMPYPFLSNIGSYGSMLAPPQAEFLTKSSEFILTLKDAFSTPDPQRAVVDFCRTSFDILQRMDPWSDIEWITEPLTYAPQH